MPPACSLPAKKRASAMNARPIAEETTPSSHSAFSRSQLKPAISAQISMSPISSARLCRRMAAGGFTPVREAAPVCIAPSLIIHSDAIMNAPPPAPRHASSAWERMAMAAMPATA